MELLNIFSQIGDWFRDQANAVIISIAISFITGILVKNGWSVMIDKFSKRAKVISKEIGETFMKGAEFFEKVDLAINDDGTIEQNSVKEAIAAGKEVYIEGKDVIVAFKPKKALPAPNPTVTAIKEPKKKRPVNKSMIGRKWR